LSLHTSSASAMMTAAVVIVSAKELSIGTTKLSGFQPRLKVKIATAYAMPTMTETAKMLVVKSCPAKAAISHNVAPLIKEDKTA
jgi:hypothetical protein